MIDRRERFTNFRRGEREAPMIIPHHRGLFGALIDDKERLMLIDPKRPRGSGETERQRWIGTERNGDETVLLM
jgi:hypothetical protein